MDGQNTDVIIIGGIRYRAPLRRLSLLSRDFFRHCDELFATPIWYRERRNLLLAANEVLWRQLQSTAQSAEAESIP